MISPICTTVSSEPLPMEKEPRKCGFTGYMGRVIYSLSFCIRPWPLRGIPDYAERAHRGPSPE